MYHVSQASGKFRAIDRLTIPLPVSAPMRREEKRRKFNEAVLNFLYPPPPAATESEDEDDPPSISQAEVKLDFVPLPDDSGGSGGSSESDDNDEADGGKGKLTRAQRKRLRRKKLREEAARRGKMIGPLLPPSKDDDSGGHQEIKTPVVRKNAHVEPAAGERQGDAAASTKQKRVKHRRMIKKLAKDSKMSTEDE